MGRERAGWKIPQLCVGCSRWFNLLPALLRDAFVSDATNFSALRVYGFGFNSEDINVAFSSICAVTRSAQLTLGRLIMAIPRRFLGGRWLILALAEP